MAKKHNFFDSGLLYQFCINFRRRRRLSELLNEKKQENDAAASPFEDSSLDSPFNLCKDSLLEPNSAFECGKNKAPVFARCPLLWPGLHIMVFPLTSLQWDQAKPWKRSSVVIEPAWMAFSTTLVDFHLLFNCLQTWRWDLTLNQARRSSVIDYHLFKNIKTLLRLQLEVCFFVSCSAEKTCHMWGAIVAWCTLHQRSADGELVDVVKNIA